MEHKFELNVGDVIRLKMAIKSVIQYDDWKTGLYRVKRIASGFGTSRSDENKRNCQVYTFEKVKKDGTLFKNFKYFGYNCETFDTKFLNAGIAVKI